MNRIIQHDVKQTLPLEDKTVNCCVTSPPYWGLRDYGKEGQLGLEKTPEEFISNMVEVFREVKRVLKDDGTLWVNIGDSYAGSGKGANDYTREKRNTLTEAHHNIGHTTGVFMSDIYKPKDLVGIPWMLAFALRADGWYLRQDIIWHKPNPMPESVTDRCTKSHEYIFLLSKSQRYYYDADAIRTEAKNPLDDLRRIEAQTWDNKNTPDKLRNGIRPTKVKIPGGWDRGEGSHGTIHRGGRTSAEYQIAEIKSGANKRTVWTVPTMPYSEAHFATFPEDLIVDCIKAGCPENGLILDPFMGAGTTALVSAKLNRNFIGFELNEKYIKIAEKRLSNQLGMFNPLRA
jgi:DNA modification methylase